MPVVLRTSQVVYADNTQTITGAKTFTGNVTLSDVDIVLGTSVGSKIGTAINQLLGFFGVAPVDQPAAVTDPTGGVVIDAECRTAVIAINDRLQELGLVA